MIRETFLSNRSSGGQAIKDCRSRYWSIKERMENWKWRKILFILKLHWRLFIIMSKNVDGWARLNVMKAPFFQCQWLWNRNVFGYNCPCIAFINNVSLLILFYSKILFTQYAHWTHIDFSPWWLPHIHPYWRFAAQMSWKQRQHTKENARNRCRYCLSVRTLGSFGPFNMC